MTDLERQVLASVLEFARANDELRGLLSLWGKPGFSRNGIDTANGRATRARERFQKVSDEYRVFNDDRDETVADLLSTAAAADLLAAPHEAAS